MASYDREKDLADGQTVGVQVTEVDPYLPAGTKRAEEKNAGEGVYSMFGQNDPGIILDGRTKACLEASKFDRCFFLSILGVEEAFYCYEKSSGWRKAVGLEDIRDTPRAAYVECVMQAAAAGDRSEADRLCDEEVKLVPSEMRGRGIPGPPAEIEDGAARKAEGNPG